jgi:predicted DNA-binding helix-hairpin-helix protein
MGVIKGLFLSSAVWKDPDSTVEKELESIQCLRELGYTGYVHLRLMPGMSRYLIKETVKLADRIGVNLEAPTSEIFSEICPDKGDFKTDVLKRLEWICKEARKVSRREEWGHSKAGVDTQVVVGAVSDTDEQYLRLTDWLYRKLGLRRVYYSGFEPIPGTPLEKQKPCSPSREYRLYQASFLLRDYGFRLSDLLSILKEGYLPNIDPKLAFAKKNPDLFPIDLNEAEKLDLMKVPGIGPVTATKIIKAREKVKIRYFSDLEKIVGKSLAKRIMPFVKLQEKRLTEFRL